MQHIQPSIMNIDNIIVLFCQYAGITREELYGESRRKDIWNTRYMLMHYLHYAQGLSANELARLFNRTRGSVFRGLRTIRSHIKFHKNVKDEYDFIVERIGDSL